MGEEQQELLGRVAPQNRRVLRYIFEHPGRTREQIAKALDCTVNRVDKLVYRLGDPIRQLVLSKPKPTSEVNVKAKILLFDIETSPNVAYVWGKYEQDVIRYLEEWKLISVAWKWLGQKRISVASNRRFTEKEILEQLWKLFDEADVLIAHNGNRFDIKKSNAKFIEHEMHPPSPYKKVDTRLEARKHFMFNSNKLDDLAQLLGVGKKIRTGGFDLWEDCLAGIKRAWIQMERYNKRDVKILEGVYLKIRPWMDNHPNANLYGNSHFHCRTCGSGNVQPTDKLYYTTVSKRVMYFCFDCCSWSKGELIKSKTVLR